MNQDRLKPTPDDAITDAAAHWCMRLHAEDLSEEERAGKTPFIYEVKKGKLSAEKYEQRMALLSTTLSYDELNDADLVIEAVFEEIGVKEAVFKELDRVMKPGAILASNTSTLDVDKIAAFTTGKKGYYDDVPMENVIIKKAVIVE